jgi:carbamoyl-phosphate synthase large subunit
MNPLCIAVSGLHRGENPQPGSGIIRSLRRAWPGVRIVGLVYDVMESGIYADDGPDEVQLMPYPAAGATAFFQRLDAVHRKTPINILIPSLDAEIELLVHLRAEFAARGIRVCLPEAESLRRRAKQSLPALAGACGVPVPKTYVAHDVVSAYRGAVELGLPLLIKGPYYDAQMVYSLPHAQATAAHLLAEWGTPVILQRRIAGPEFNVLGIGDGRGGIIAQCSIRKTVLSDKGKGLGGIVVRDEQLDRRCEDLIRELRWNGPFEIEWIRDSSTDQYVLIEINPRFPAWIDFPAMLGANFAAALVERILEAAPVCPLPACRPGAFFLRHQVEVAGDISRYAGLLCDDIAPADSPSAPAISNHSTATLP